MRESHLGVEPQSRGIAATQPAQLSGLCAPISLACSRINPRPPAPQAVTVGAGIELQAQRGVAALQGALLHAHAAVGPARLRAARAAAPGRVVCAGETIKLQ